MWDMIAALTTAVLGIILSAVLIFYDQKHLKDIRIMNTIPGPSPSSAKDGNTTDINEQGGLMAFLLELHKKWGELASFWIGKQFIVTTSTPAMFKKVKKISHRPVGLLENYKHILGKTSIWFTNGSSWRERADLYKDSFTPDLLHQYFITFCKLSKSLSKTWKSQNGDVTFNQLQTDVQEMTCQAIVANLFGDTLDGTKMKKLVESYIECVYLTEALQIGNPDNTDRMKALNDESRQVRDVICDVIASRSGRDHVASEDGSLIDRIISRNGRENRDGAVDDCLAYLSGGLYKMSAMLTWTIHYLSMYQDVQSRLRHEIDKVTSPNSSSYKEINSCSYLRQFINETLRCSKMSPFLARETPSEIKAPGGIQVIPEKTVVIQCLAQEFEDPSLWQDPFRFDPEHFDEERFEGHVGRTFEPFGYAGHRRCPGMRYAYLFASAFLVHLLRDCKVVRSSENSDVLTRNGLIRRITADAACSLQSLT